MTRPLFLILASVTLDAMGIALIFPILPALLRTMTGRSEVAELFGAMLALYGLMQFLCSPVLGVLSDRYGRRPMLLVSIAASAVDYLMMAFAPWLWLVFCSRALAGMTGANIVVASAYIADITPEAQRAHRFGLFHAFSGVGFVAGLVVGGMLGDIWLREPFLVAAVLTGLNFLIVLLMLPESYSPLREPIRYDSLNPFAPLRWAFAYRSLAPLLGICVLLSLAGQAYGAVWVLFTTDRFQWTATDVGLSLALFGALVALVQACATGRMTARIGERGTLVFGIVCETVALLGIAFATASWLAFAAVPLIALGRIGLPALQTMQANSVSSEHQGRLQGVVVGLTGLTGICGPLLFTQIYAVSRPDWSGLVWIVCAAMGALAIPIILSMSRER